jgi:hypothetical protein
MRARKKWIIDYGMQVFKLEEPLYCQNHQISNYIYCGGKKTN